MKRILVLLVAVTPATASADKMWNQGKGTTWDCAKDPVVTIAHGKATYTFKGTCKTVNISGATNKVKAEHVEELNVSGSSNTIDVGTLGRVNLSGSQNKVTFKDGDAPQINITGTQDVVTRAGGTEPATATPAVATTTIDCSKNALFEYAENNGTFKFTGACQKIAISGNNNQLEVETAQAIIVSGNGNVVAAAAVDSIMTAGNENKVTYKKTATPKATIKIMNPGNKNKIAKAK
ncbi:MAG: DUF3060 domain-containing protein [Kofleriaceae bacterium]|nr:DUF3060 domain-containing protein [Kofleriaceae bacterium]